METVGKVWSRAFGVRKHSGSGDNVSLARLGRNAAPYLTDRSGGAHYPLTIFFTINGRCNLLCEMCDVGQKNRQSMFVENIIGDGADFDPERYKQIIDEVAFFKPYIALTTTEPILYKPLVEIMEYTVRKGLKANITTNGTQLRAKAEGLVKSGLQRLSVSIDGPPRSHDIQRGVAGVWQKAMLGIEEVRQWREKLGVSTPQIYINTAITNINYADLVELVESLPLDLVDQVNMKLVVFMSHETALEHNCRWGHKYPLTEHCLAGEVRPNEIDIDVLVEQCREIQRRWPEKVKLHFDIDRVKFEKYFNRPDEFMDHSRCVFPWFIAQITNQGNLICYTRCYPTTFGNVYDRSFLDLWNGPAMKEFRRDLKSHGRFPGCTRCDGVLYR